MGHVTGQPVSAERLKLPGSQVPGATQHGGNGFLAKMGSGDLKYQPVANYHCFSNLNW